MLRAPASAGRPPPSPTSPGCVGTFFARIRPFWIGLLLLISITRYWRWKTECSLFEKLTFPESVLTLWNFCITAASLEPTSEPLARLIAVTMPSIAAGPVTNPPVRP